jgi:hypothetical protein
VTESFFVAGLDLGQAQDYTALGVVEVMPTVRPCAIEDMDDEYQVAGPGQIMIPGSPALALRHLERFPLGTPYPDLVVAVAGRLRAIPGGALLAIDKTGVGAAVVDMFALVGMPYIAVTITAGNAVTGEGRDWGVPKRDLVHGLLVALQQGRFRAAARLPAASVMMSELWAFRLKVNPVTGHDSYEAWRETEHDDLVLATALACWLAEREVEARAEAAQEAALQSLSIGRVRISPF